MVNKMSVALHQYKSVMHSNGHVITVKKTGFMVSQRDIFVGACPDALLSCGWCGDGCLEIKCSLSITHTGPLTTPPPYLKKTFRQALIIHQSSILQSGELNLHIYIYYWFMVRLPIGLDFHFLTFLLHMNHNIV